MRPHPVSEDDGGVGGTRLVDLEVDAGAPVRDEFVIGFRDRLVNVETPSHVSLHVTSTAAPERSVGQGGSVMKEARLENGLTVNVPLFIKNGDLIRVDARDRTYAGKEKEHA